MGSHVSRIEESWSSFKILTTTGKRPFGGPRRRWEDMIFKETGVNTRNWFDSARDRVCCRALVNTALNLPVVHGAMGCGQKNFS